MNTYVSKFFGQLSRDFASRMVKVLEEPLSDEGERRDLQ